MASDAYNKVSQRVGDLGHEARVKADSTISTVGEQITGMAGTLRSSLPSEGTVGSAVQAVADRLESGGRYLSQHNIDDITAELRSVVKNHPLQSLAVGFGLGLALSGLFRRR